MSTMTIEQAMQQLRLVLRVERDLLAQSRREDERQSLLRTIQALELAVVALKRGETLRHVPRGVPA